VFFCPEELRTKGEQLIQDVQKRALRMEGTITGEHGIGLSLRDMLLEEIGDSGVNLTRKVWTNDQQSMPSLTTCFYRSRLLWIRSVF
jgi:FAD/FMN-containing dehydrogenase